MSAYKAFVIGDNNGAFSGKVTIRSVRDLPPGDVLVKVKYSSLNYLDALALTGSRAVMKKYPHTPGMDAAGIVIESSSPDFYPGDEVFVAGSGLGFDISGGFGEYVRVKAGCLMYVPTGLTMESCMAIGSDGLAAAVAVMGLIAAGGSPEAGEAVVSGAVAGTGCFALALLAKCGFRVTAVIRNTANAELARTIGAAETLSCEKFSNQAPEPVLAGRYSVGVDTLGGEVLSAIIRSLKNNGSVAVCSAIGSENLSVSVRPFVFRSVNVLGVNICNCSQNLKKEAWYKLAGEWYPKILPMLYTEISLMELPEYSKRLLKDEIKGRIVINHEL